MIDKVIKVGNLQLKPHHSGNVYYAMGISPTIMAGTHGWGMGYILTYERK